MRPIPVMLALLLALSPVAVAFQTPGVTAKPPSASHAVAAQSGQPQTDGNTTTVMTLGSGPGRTALADSSLALGSALASDHNSLQTRLSVDALDERLANAESSEEKKQILNRYRFRIENRIISLQAREERVTNDFLNGTLSTRAYLRSIGRIDAEASRLRTAIRALKNNAQSTAFGIDEQALQTKLVTVEGPVRHRIAKAMQGRATTTETYVAAADSGIVLSTIVDGTYVREAYRSDNRKPSQQQTITVGDAMTEVIRPQYPWVSDTDHWTGSRNWGSGRLVFPAIQSIKYTYVHPHGNLTAYVDTGTASVYREIQYKRLVGENTLPPGPAVTNSSANLTLAVNRTYPGGPLRVRLTNASGAPVQGEISIDGETEGRTSDDGVLWMLGPDRTFEVSATYDGRTVTLTTAPTSPATPQNVTLSPVNVTSMPVNAS